MLGFGILSGLLILPLVGAAFILTLRGDSEAARSNARCAALEGKCRVLDKFVLAFC